MQPWEFKCSVTGRCIPFYTQCNGVRECPHYEDEFPKNTKCQSTYLCQRIQRKKRKGKEADLYSAFIEVPYTQGAQVRITQCYLR